MHFLFCPQIGSILPEGIVIQQNDQQESDAKAMIMELSSTSSAGEFIDVQPQTCTYHIVNPDNKNQVYELHLDGSHLPFMEVSSGQKVKEETVTFIQEGDAFTVINQADIDNSLNLKIDSDAINGVRSQTESERGIAPKDEPSVSTSIACEIPVAVPVSSDDQILNQTSQDNVDHQHMVALVSSDADVQRELVESVQSGVTFFEGERVSFESGESLSVTIAELKSDDLSQSQPQLCAMNNEDGNQVLLLSQKDSIFDSPFIANPKLDSQEYYYWLAIFSESCRKLEPPLEKDIFLKISQVQKTLSDYMAMPSGVISDKNNFKILMNITQDLSKITSQHLSLMFSNLSS